MHPDRKQWPALAALLALCLTVGLIGGYATAQSLDGWYLAINRPNWTPPSWIFAPVWTALYVMMAVAAWLVWKRDVHFTGVRLALVLFFVQLLFNFLGTKIPEDEFIRAATNTGMHGGIGRAAIMTDQTTRRA